MILRLTATKENWEWLCVRSSMVFRSELLGRTELCGARVRKGMLRSVPCGLPITPAWASFTVKNTGMQLCPGHFAEHYHIEIKPE